MELSPNFQSEIKLDGSEKNLSLLKPESVLERTFNPVSESQEQAGKQNEALWLQTLREKLSQNTQSETENSQLNSQMNEIMVKLVEKKAQYGDYCVPFGIGETNAVLLTTPIRQVGESSPDPSGQEGELSSHMDHIYVLATERGFFGLTFNKTVTTIHTQMKPGVNQLEIPNPNSSLHEDIPGYKEETTEKLKEWTRENTEIVGSNTFDELHGPFSERALAYATQEHCWKRDQSFQEASKQSLMEDRQKEGVSGEPSQDEIDSYARNRMKSEDTGIFFDINGKPMFQIGSFQLYGDSILPLSDQQLVQDAISASRENAQKPRVEPTTEVRQQLQTAQNVLSVI